MIKRIIALALAILTLVIAHALFGCATHLPKSMSYDQENLKSHDSGCPTSIYIAPNGILEQCPPK